MVEVPGEGFVSLITSQSFCVLVTIETKYLVAGTFCAILDLELQIVAACLRCPD